MTDSAICLAPGSDAMVRLHSLPTCEVGFESESNIPLHSYIYGLRESNSGPAVCETAVITN